MTVAADVLRTLDALHFRYATEDELQEAIAAALDDAGIDAEREVILGPRDRIDLLADAVGIECKVAGGRDCVLRQLTRYAASDRIGELVLVTNRARQSQLPSSINGKPVTVVSLGPQGL